MKLSRKLLFASFLLVAVFLLSYFVAFWVISLTPFGYYTYTERNYSTSHGPFPYNTSDVGGEWSNQLLFLSPGPGATNVPRDAAIYVDEPRPVDVENMSLSPYVPIAKETNQVSSNGGPPSGTYMCYPAELLQPNTTYNVSAMVTGKPSWWTFTTSSEPSQPTLSTHTQLASYVTWVAFTAAILTTLAVGAAVLLQKRDAHSGSDFASTSLFVL